MATLSPLLTQLHKQNKGQQSFLVDEDRIDDVYQIITKIESKNLMLSEFVAFIIEKGLIKNSQKIQLLVDIFDEVKASPEPAPENTKGKVEDEQKFSKKKFLKAVTILAHKIYPGDPLSFEKIIYPRISTIEVSDQVRLKVDDIVRKMLTRETLTIWKQNEREFQILFQTYMPENFNEAMGFTWKELRYLEKKLPLVCVFRILWESQIIPTYISPGHFIETVSKIFPIQTHINGNNQKEALFYSSETIINYSKEAVFSKKIKLLQGDIGLNLFDFQVLLTKLSMDMSKDKNDPSKALQILLDLMKLKESISLKGESKGKPNKLEEHIKGYFMAETKKTGKNNNFQIQKRETKKKIQQILDFCENIDEDGKMEFREAKITQSELRQIRRSLEEDNLPPIPDLPKVQKENQPTYNINEKYIVIGEQLPKIQEKNKPAAPKKNQKGDENSHRFKMEVPEVEDISSDHYREILKKPFKRRVNEQFPIILTNAIYPTDIPNLSIQTKAQLYLETTYIQLGQKAYEQAFINFFKARSISESAKNPLVEFFFTILEAQIYQSSGRDSISLLTYHKAKELTQTLLNKDGLLKCYALRGLANCLYHLEEYEYALRCYVQVEELKKSYWDQNSAESAMIQNNIGCCYMILNRNNEACKYFEIAHSILDLQLGRFNERTLIAEQNIKKNKKTCVQNPPSYNTMWKTFINKPGKKEGAKKAAAKKK